MIEKYFKLGVRYRWQKPPNVDGPRDGAIVDGIRLTAPLTYIGLGSLVEPSLMQIHVSQLGLQMNMPIQHKWLDYVPGRTARVAMGPYDVLTGFMSGCLITRWMDRGVIYAGHVGTVESDPAVNRTVKHTYAAAMPPGTTGFNPFQAWLGEIATLHGRLPPPNKTPQICALVTTQGEFYSIAMFQEPQGGEYYCGGIKRVPPMGHAELTRQLQAV